MTLDSCRECVWTDIPQPHSAAQDLSTICFQSMRLTEGFPVGVAFVSSTEFSTNEFVLSQGVYENFLTPSEDSASQGGWGGLFCVLHLLGTDAGAFLVFSHLLLTRTVSPNRDRAGRSQSFALPSLRLCISHSVPSSIKPMSTVLRAAEVPGGGQPRCQEGVTPDRHALGSCTTKN